MAPTPDAPDDTAPDGTALDDTAPDGTAPDDTALDDTAPDDTALDDTAPDGTALDDIDRRLDALVARDQEQVRCPFPLFADIRAADPVHFSEELGAWVLTRFEDCLAVLHDPVTWSVRMRTGPKPLNAVMAARLAEIVDEPGGAELVGVLERVSARSPILSSADPPLHSRQRKLVNATFKPGRIRDLEPLITEVAHALIDDFWAHGRVELVSQFAVGLPMTIIAHALGVGDQDLQQFKRWSDDLVMPVGNQNPSVAQVRGFLETHRDFAAFFSARLGDRRAAPTGDLISDIANAEIDGVGLTEREQLEVISQLLAAGNETTTKLLTDIALYLARHPDVQARVRADHRLVTPLVEEVLRLEAPVSGLFRVATTDTEVGGQAIAAGEHVWVLYAAANRDDARFADPDAFDIDRADVKDHLGFGHGQHYCLGAGLARAEARLGTIALLDRIGDIALADGNDFAYEDSYLLRGLHALHVTFDPLPS